VYALIVVKKSSAFPNGLYLSSAYESSESEAVDASSHNVKLFVLYLMSLISLVKSQGLQEIGTTIDGVGAVMKVCVDQILDVVSIGLPDLFDGAASIWAKIEVVLAVICILWWLFGVCSWIYKLTLVSRSYHFATFIVAGKYLVLHLALCACVRGS
jgi:hypothetical protein